MEDDEEVVARRRERVRGRHGAHPVDDVEAIGRRSERGRVDVADPRTVTGFEPHVSPESEDAVPRGGRVGEGHASRHAALRGLVKREVPVVAEVIAFDRLAKERPGERQRLPGRQRILSRRREYRRGGAAELEQEGMVADRTGHAVGRRDG